MAKIDDELKKIEQMEQDAKKRLRELKKRKKDAELKRDIAKLKDYKKRIKELEAENDALKQVSGDDKMHFRRGELKGFSFAMSKGFKDISVEDLGAEDEDSLPDFQVIKDEYFDKNIIPWYRELCGYEVESYEELLFLFKENENYDAIVKSYEDYISEESAEESEE